ncbi:hypothetical protein D4R49_01480 [bacterium]|nr:MAG: hypothetical protein D4R49_01480 [bacterium]
MNAFSSFTFPSYLFALVSIVILIGCGDKSNDVLPIDVKAKKVDQFEFLRDVNPESPADKRLFQKSFSGDRVASYRAAAKYVQGRFGKPLKSDQAVAYLTVAAESGDWEAMNMLQILYGKELKNPDKQDYWRIQFRDKVLAAANQGDVKALVRLGYEYSFGGIFPKDEKQSCNWFQKAAATGDADGEHKSGQCFTEGKGGSLNLDEGLRLLTLAADKGKGWAMADLLQIYRSKRRDKALEDRYFDQLMSLTSPEESSGPFFAAGSYCTFGMNYSSECQHPLFRKQQICKKCSAEDEQKSVSLYQKGAELGDASSALALARMYEKTTRQDVLAANNARQWFEKAADLGDTYAQFKVGAAYFYGLGSTPKDTEKAAAWIAQSASKGWGEAQSMLGVMYSKGIGVTEDLVIAYAWLNLAVSNLTGPHNAKERDEVQTLLSLLEKRLTPEQLVESQRLSSNWEYGRPLVSSSSGTGAASKSGTLIRKMTGTAFVVGNSGHTITNQHVVQGCKEIRIEGREGVAKSVTDDTVNDIALIQIPGEIKSTAMISADSGKLRQGEDIVVFGFPLNAVLSSGGNLTPGVVSALTGLGNNTNQIQITAPIQPGSSGSPVLNKKGEVVGVVSMKLSDSKMAKATGQIGQNVNFAVSGQTLKTFLDTHKVEYRSAGFFSFEKSTADLADEARKWTLVVECWK